MLSFEELLTEVSILFVSNIDSVDVVLVLESQVFQGTLQVFDVSGCIALHFCELTSQAVALSFSLHAASTFLVKRNFHLLKLRVQVSEVFKFVP